MRRSGLFAALRRRRFVLSAIFAYALLVNGMLATLIAGQSQPAASGPLAAIADAPLCDPGSAGGR